MVPAPVLLRSLLTFSLLGFLFPKQLPAQSSSQSKAGMIRLADTERAFAAKSVAEGMRPAFLEYFAPDGINFTPHPVNTRESINSRPAPPTKPPVTLDWWPILGDVSLSGDLGYTTGPYLLTDSRENNKVVGQGYYFSVWKRQPDGSWRVAVDYGIETPVQGVSKDKAVFHGSHWPGTKTKAAPGSPRSAILARENAFAEQSMRRGALAAYREFTSWDNETRLYRDRENPIVGRAALSAYLSKLQEKPSWHSTTSGVAASGDLAYTYGQWKTGGTAPRSGYFVRVWRLIRGDWRVVLEVMNPLPSP